LQSLQESEDSELPILSLVPVIGENKNKGLSRKNWLFLPAILIKEEHKLPMKSSYSEYNAIDISLIFYLGQIKLWLEFVS